MRVLIAEDELTLREGLTDLLEGAGYTVAAVEDGMEATRLGEAEADCASPVLSRP